MTEDITFTCDACISQIDDGDVITIKDSLGDLLDLSTHQTKPSEHLCEECFTNLGAILRNWMRGKRNRD